MPESPASIESLFESTFSAFLFDMDGTLLTSIPATNRVWAAWCEQHGLNVQAVLPTIHGQRAADTIQRLLAGRQFDLAEETAKIARGEIEDLDGVSALPGAAAFLRDLPAERWAVVTSAGLPLAQARLGAAGLPMPNVIVTAESVTFGKPAPDGFILGRVGLAWIRQVVWCGKMRRPAWRQPKRQAAAWWW